MSFHPGNSHLGDGYLEGDSHPRASRAFLVWIISGDHWMRACLRAELLERELEAVGYENLAQALPEGRMPSPICPDAILLDLDSLDPCPEELATLGKLRTRIIVLVGKARAIPEWLPGLQPVQILYRPLTLGQVADVIQQVVLAG